MDRTYIYSYIPGSHSVANLTSELDIFQIRHKNSKFKGNLRKTVINWGSSNLPDEVLKCKIINDPSKVAICSDKLKFFETLQGTQVSVVPWTTDKNEVRSWIDSGYEVFARTLLKSHSGNGIIILDSESEIVDAPLYTMYIKKESEWRLHYIGGQLAFIQRKVKDPNIEQPKDWRIRAHQNGFIYQQNNESIPEKVIEQGNLAYKTIGLDFGAIDIIYNKRNDKAYILEINTAPGLENTTVNIYAQHLKRICA